MKRYFLYILVLSLVVAIIPMAAIASDIGNALWTANLRITNAGDDATNVATVFNANSTALIEIVYINNEASDIVVRYGGEDIPFMPGYDDDPWAVFVESINSGGNIDYEYYSGNASGGDIAYFPDDGGMTISDNETMEISGNGTIGLYDTWVDTDAGVSKDLFSHYDIANGGVRCFVSDTVSENVTARNVTVSSATANMTVDGMDTIGLNHATPAVAHNLNVDDAIGAPDGDTSYVGSKTDQNWRQDIFTLTDPTPLGDAQAITAVTVYYSFGNGGNVHAEIIPSLFLDGNETVGTTESLTLENAYFDYNEVLTRPGGGTWVWDDLSDLMVAAEMKQYFTDATCWDKLTQIYVSVSYDYYNYIDVTATGVSTGEHDVEVTQGYALDFVPANTDNVTVGDNNAFSFTDGVGNDRAFSIEAWVKYDDATSGAVISKFGSSGANLWEWSFHTGADDKLYLFLGHLGGTQYIYQRTDVLTGYEGEWIHVAATYDGSEIPGGIILYIIGSPVAMTSGDSGAYTGMSNTAADVKMGCRANDDFYLDGAISELKMYSDVQTPAEILADYNGTHNSDNLLAWWKINEGAGNPADSSGNAFNGVNNGADWIVGTLELYIDGVLEDITQGVSVPNSDADWTVGDDDVTPYIGNFLVEVDGTEVCDISWEYDTIFHDASGHDNDATPTRRTASSDADVSASLQNWRATSEKRVDSFDLISLYEILTGDISTPTNMYEGGDYSKLPAEPINEILDESDVPRAAWWLPFIFLGICIVGFIAYGATSMTRGQNGKIAEGQLDGSMLFMVIVIEALLVIMGKMGPIEYWPSYLFPIAGIAIILSRKHFSWG